MTVSQQIQMEQAVMMVTALEAIFLTWDEEYNGEKI